MTPDFAPQSTAGSDPESTTGGGPADRCGPAGAANAMVRQALRSAARACCCTARPAVIAIMPPAPGRDHATDLLLCGHHYMASRLALMEAGATVFDGAGRPVIPPARVLLGTC